MEDVHVTKARELSEQADLTGLYIRTRRTPSSVKRNRTRQRIAVCFGPVSVRMWEVVDGH